ncbi:transcriptional regulator [Halobacteriales archaeon QS_8_69_26]|nr:MAG: transcriptional regulator [Halobacteriales archaeon QS_8_69_26]
MDEPDTDRAEAIPAAEAFGILGNETRTEILRALVERDDEAPLSFSELREAVGTGDSGRFNYHLQQLVGHFVEHDEDGYAFRYHGRRIAHAILAGTFTDRARVAPAPAPGACYACGAEALEGSYENETLTIRCTACEERIVSVPFSPAAVRGRTPAEVFAAFDRWSTAQANLAAGGVCPECTGHMDGRVTTDVADYLDFDVLPRFECRVCRRTATTSFGSVALNHPAVQSFHHRHDAYPRQRPYWTIPQLVSDRHTEVLSEDPWRVRVAFPIEDGPRVEATIDGSVAVVGVTEHVDG